MRSLALLGLCLCIYLDLKVGSLAFSIPLVHKYDTGGILKTIQMMVFVIQTDLLYKKYA